MSVTQTGMNVAQSLLLHNIIQATEQDDNLSQLPDEFKDVAIQIMFNNALQNNQCTSDINVNDISNKRSRCDLIDDNNDMDCHGADGE